jgi:hypothetical protein
MYKKVGYGSATNLPKISEILVKGEVGDWYYVHTDKGIGFVKKSPKLVTEKPPTLQDYITVIDDPTYPVHISIVDNTVSITAYLAISGDLADMTFPDTSTKYRELIVTGIKEKWKASSINVFGFDTTVKITVVDVNDGKSHSLNNNQRTVPVYTHNKLGVSNMSVPRILFLINNWSVANPGYFDMYVGDSRGDAPSAYKLQDFKTVAAHEFGHILGMDDLYAKSDATIKKYSEKDNWSLMGHQWYAPHINNFDMQMVLTAFSENKWQVWK